MDHAALGGNLKESLMDKKPLWCRLRRHAWKHEHNEDGQGYYICLRCGTTRDEFHLSDSSGFLS